MALPNVMQTGRGGMVAAKAQMSTSSHNIANANTEGYSRQRTDQKADMAVPHGPKSYIGTGVQLARTQRINDHYVEKQLRNVGRELGNLEERDFALKQAEDIFNEMGGEGLNRLVSKFFNDFRKLGNDPDSEAVRHSVRESSQAMVNDFHRVRSQVEELRSHLDARIDGYSREVNAITKELTDLNTKIKVLENGGAPANDLNDHRDLLVKKLNSYLDIQTHNDKDGGVNIDVRGIGPLVNGPNHETFTVHRTPQDAQGKAVNALSIHSTGAAMGDVTHTLKGGKLGALLEVRDQTLTDVLGRLDELAKAITDSVNAVHTEGFTRDGTQGVAFFKQIDSQDRAAAEFGLSDSVKANVNNIAAAAAENAPSDNRIAVAISQIQNMRLMNGGRSSVDDFYNSIVSDIGVASGRARSNLTQQKDIELNLNKIREQNSGVSIDEETANLLQFQHAYDASARVIQVADECLKTVLNIGR
jgi:flagellar hook-associated protein 1